MTWTRSIPTSEATGPLAATYAQILAGSSQGRVSNVWLALGLDPDGLAATHPLYRAMIGEPLPLSDLQARLIAVVVSATNGCEYCVAHQGPHLAAALGDEPLARAVALDYRTANLTARDRVLLDHCVALTCEPSERKLEDIERIREYGFDDASIVKAVEITAYYNLINRVVTGLGVELEADLAPWEFGSQK
ncbi:MAG: peroxidase-related enzyme [Candidatus Eisenbacteria bacterium]|uniref:Peroxidase-related enzyme n=1 Tax=Eiseniibacteriota bacterium TaxID=2212470 RepID=A0A849SML0_UNCEI|nr:peroxidase-related enzyme [Candidatus Eisenbacteria bacterium]